MHNERADMLQRIAEDDLTRLLTTRLTRDQLNVLAGIITSLRCLEHSLRGPKIIVTPDPKPEVFKIQ
jgi:hypothetical protein